MNENINLCKILKGHEGEVFYSSLHGELIFRGIVGISDVPLHFTDMQSKFDIYFTSQGKINPNGPECILFPSKDHRDWNKWIAKPSYTL